MQTLLSTLCALAIWSADEVSYLDDAGTRTLEAVGNIVEENPREILLTTTKGEELSIPVQRVTAVKYDSQPAELINVRNLERQGKHAEAIAEYEKILPDIDADRDPFLLDWIGYSILQQRCAEAAADPSLRDAALKDYESRKERLAKSRHHYPSLELIGQLYLDARDFDRAEEIFKQIGTSGAPVAKDKSIYYQARIAMAREQFPQALGFFDEVIAARGASADVAAWIARAKIGKAEALAKTNKAKEAIEICRSVIAAAEDDDEILASAHNALGDALAADGNPKGAALDGYLWVHVLYPKDAREHARALYHLARLLREIGYPAYADQMAQQLQTDFRQTEWGQRAAAGSSG